MQLDPSRCSVVSCCWLLAGSVVAIGWLRGAWLLCNAATLWGSLGLAIKCGGRSLAAALGFGQLAWMAACEVYPLGAVDTGGPA